MEIRTQLLKTILRAVSKKNFEDFKNDLGKRESGNNYLIKNTLGYLGRWQFGMARLCDYGIVEKVEGKYKWMNGYSEEIFLNNPCLQDKVFKWHVENLKSYIEKNLYDYLGKNINGIYIDVSGLVAGSHLGGIGNVKKFLQAGENKVDAYGTSIGSYIQNFTGYRL